MKPILAMYLLFIHQEFETKLLFLLCFFWNFQQICSWKKLRRVKPMVPDPFVSRTTRVFIFTVHNPYLKGRLF